MENCLKNEKVQDEILNQRIEAQKKYKIESTPTIFINENKYDKNIFTYDMVNQTGLFRSVIYSNKKITIIFKYNGNPSLSASISRSSGHHLNMRLLGVLYIYLRSN